MLVDAVCNCANGAQSHCGLVSEPQSCLTALEGDWKAKAFIHQAASLLGGGLPQGVSFLVDGTFMLPRVWAEQTPPASEKKQLSVLATRGWRTAGGTFHCTCS